MKISSVEEHSKYNYDGGFIIHKCNVPASRSVINQPDAEYNIDVREFLVTEKNEVIKDTLECKVQLFLKNFEKSATGKSLRQLLRLKKSTSFWEYFSSRDSGSFDFRALVICKYLSTILTYESMNDSNTTEGNGRTINRDPWLFPDELLRTQKGDCEDISLLLASLLITSGISPYNIRVALGKVVQYDSDKKQTEYDHMWVMYKRESAQWQLLEPLLCVKPTKNELETTIERSEYKPLYSFNDSHLWGLNGDLNDFGNHVKANWKRINPSFASVVHKQVLNTAFAELITNGHIVGIEKIHIGVLNNFSWLFGYDDPDSPFTEYDPIAHFDNGYIKEGWDRVKKELDKAKAIRDNNPDVENMPGNVFDEFTIHLTFAFHGIADFYAHSTFIHFNGNQTGGNGLYTRYDGLLPGASYDQGLLEIGSTKLNINTSVYDLNVHTIQEAQNYWNGKVISGRFAQKGDSFHNTGFFEGVAIALTQSIPKELSDKPDFFYRGALPHHNDIAVDENANDDHVIYKSDHKIKAYQYPQQIVRRRWAAQEHIQRAMLYVLGLQDPF